MCAIMCVPSEKRELLWYRHRVQLAAKSEKFGGSFGGQGSGEVNWSVWQKVWSSGHAV